MGAKRRIAAEKPVVSVTRHNNHVEFAMECISAPKEIGKIEGFLTHLNKTARLDDGTFYRLFVSCTEAVNNAILHGNKSDPRKKVCVTCSVNRESVSLRVKDEGKGFDPGKVPNPLDDQNLLKESGRGIFLIRSMMDEVRFHNEPDGTTIEMVIDLKLLR